MKNSVQALALAAGLCLLTLNSPASEATKAGTPKPKTAQKANAQKATAKSTATRRAPSKQVSKTPKKSTAQLRNGKLTSGEASRLETKEASLSREEHATRVDNRGRMHSASRGKQHARKATAKKSPAKQAAEKKPIARKSPAKPAATAHTAASAKPRSGKAVVNKAAASPHAASLKTSELTSGESAKVQTKEASAPQPAHGGWSAGEKPAPAPEQPPAKASPPLHLPKNNARMF